MTHVCVYRPDGTSFLILFPEIPRVGEKVRLGTEPYRVAQVVYNVDPEGRAPTNVDIYLHEA
jgi:hypothetical protein